MCLQDFDWQMQKQNFPLHHCVTVEDFPENFTHEDSLEPQSAYWCHIQSGMHTAPSHCGWADAWLGAGMYVMVCMFHIDDLTNIPDDEKTRLKQMLTEQGLPHTITESHIGKHIWLSHCLIACALQASAQTQHMGLRWCSTSMSFSTCTCNNMHPG